MQLATTQNYLQLATTKDYLKLHAIIHPMLSGVLVFVGHLFGEISVSASKHAFKEKLFSYKVYGFLSHITGAIIFAAIILFSSETFSYNTKALPLFFIRLIAELVQCEIVYRAFVKADRTTFGFARIFTIPLLLLVDMFLGYSLSNAQFIGIGIIAAALLLYFGAEHLKGKGAHLALMSAVLSVLTISIFKYDVTNYNTPSATQLLMAVTLSLIYGIRVLFSKKDRSLFLRLKEHPMLGFVFVSEAVASSLLTYAYLFAPASLVLALSRASAVIWSVISGILYFHEKKVIHKVFFCAVLAVGLIVMVN